ncbi:MAG TPA: type III secretion system export apparatus subunit SctR [Polyangiaceae bacterium LLY-WYZ-15_(1-7)]|nr:type III secretion system export apparatus subunit SctR [Polyangiaceae bacterium LLY-WYZ-15_(1-7)]HJL04842.1 type III secretion system export apparatus subunit SctR [Polyangiaceae bacterium LLY-WYZ-15_(1-7)]HJL13237.1 type III secretion system export apparatus subunit SctR [Polyangiaceae bacterium LLY-WYZ-15_(1-7)]HJL21737.1 type III secretion system export apparatus subunit SctR [Polyangiaceae bacterium LLY-WYZ-15_(1-7)]HJL28620.1 type III secretion system export apparatus subunit SctR [Pol
MRAKGRQSAALAVATLGVAFFGAPAVAAAQDEGFGARPVVSLLALAALTVLPFLFMTATSFVKISVVLSILRNALGTGQVPSGTIITGLSVILTLYVMTPVGQEIAAVAGPAAARVDVEDPLEEDSFEALLEAIDAGKEPLRDFLERNAGERERALFLDLARARRAPDTRDDVSARDLLVLLPAFLITELAEAFQIGFLVFIPFLVIDMVVANVLLALGMHMLSPTTVSLPFKLLLFVLVEGWYLLARALVLGYA